MKTATFYDCMRGADRSTLGLVASTQCRPGEPTDADSRHHSPSCIWHFTTDKPTPDACRCECCLATHLQGT
jgi:hypothetical protein